MKEFVLIINILILLPMVTGRSLLISVIFFLKMFIFGDWCDEMITLG